MPTALLSAYDKTGLESFAIGLRELGWNLLGSAGTAKYLNERGVDTRDVAELVGPPILGHKVVTLSREIHAALLANETPEEQAELERIGMPRIDLVYVNLYPLGEEIDKHDHTFASVIEKTDIGGPPMLRSAAKGRRIVLHSKGQLPRILETLKTLREGLRFAGNARHDRFISMLVASAEREVSMYCALSADYHHSLSQGE
jgi:phosphoribosylaminoimidazolecarboxamide formyltransferase / IMP cyclohydrolase